MLRPYLSFVNLMYRLREDRGASLVEYALLLVFIAVVAIVALQTLGGNVRDEIDDVAVSITATIP